MSSAGRTYGELNERFAAAHSGTTYEHACELLAPSHLRVLDMIAGFSDEELFTKKCFD